MHDSILAAMCRYTRANPLLVAKTVPCAVFLNALRQHYWLDATTDSTPRAHALTRVRVVFLLLP